MHSASTLPLPPPISLLFCRSPPFLPLILLFDSGKKELFGIVQIHAIKLRRSRRIITEILSSILSSREKKKKKNEDKNKR